MNVALSGAVYGTGGSYGKGRALRPAPSFATLTGLFSRCGFRPLGVWRGSRDRGAGHGLTGQFGHGIDTDIEGAGAHARVQVNFDEAGSKWLVLAYANLQPA